MYVCPRKHLKVDDEDDEDEEEQDAEAYLNVLSAI